MFWLVWYLNFFFKHCVFVLSFVFSCFRLFHRLDDEELTCNVCDRAFSSPRQLEYHQQKKRHWGYVNSTCLSICVSYALLSSPWENRPIITHDDVLSSIPSLFLKTHLVFVVFDLILFCFQVQYMRFSLFHQHVPRTPQRFVRPLVRWRLRFHDGRRRLWRLLWHVLVQSTKTQSHWNGSWIHAWPSSRTKCFASLKNSVILPSMFSDHIPQPKKYYKNLSLNSRIPIATWCPKAKSNPIYFLQWRVIKMGREGLMNNLCSI